MIRGGRTIAALMGTVLLSVGLMAVAPAATASTTQTDVSFPDRLLAACVREAAGLPRDAPISAEDAAAIDALTCKYDVTDFTGIAALTGVEQIQLTGAKLTQGIADLAGLPSLRELNIHNAGPLDLGPLRRAALTSLTLHNTPVTDLGPIAGMTSLRSLDLTDTSTPDLTELRGLTALEQLKIPYNGVSDLSPLAGLTDLTFLEAHLNTISDISPLVSLTKLRHLNLLGNTVRDVTPMRSLTDLRSINLQRNDVEDVSSWDTLKRVTYIAIDHNRVSDLSSFIPMTALQTLTMDSNDVVDPTPLRDLVFIDHLDLTANHITSVEPLNGLVAPNYVQLSSQTVTLPDIVVGNQQLNPITMIDGTPLPVTSRTAQFDPASNTWTFPAAANNSLSWTSPDLGIGPYSVFSGSISQRSVDASPGLDLTKFGVLRSAGEHPVPGDLIDYTFTLENTGDTTVRDIEIDDPMPGLSAIDYDWPSTAGILASGDAVSGTATRALTQADIDAGNVHNTATASGVTTTGDAVDSDPASADVALSGRTALDVTKTAKTKGIGAPATRGDEIAYTIAVENTGTRTLSAVDVTDALPGLFDLEFRWPGNEGVLAPGTTLTATAKYSVTDADVASGSVVNTAFATATDDRGRRAADNDSATVDLEQQVINPPVGPEPVPEPEPDPATSPAPAPSTSGTGNTKPALAGGAPAPGGELAFTGASPELLVGSTVAAIAMLALGGFVLARARRTTEPADRNAADS